MPTETKKGNALEPSENARALARYTSTAGRTKAGLAKAIGVSDVMVGYWASGAKRPGDLNRFLLELHTDDAVINDPWGWLKPSEKRAIRRAEARAKKGAA